MRPWKGKASSSASPHSEPHQLARRFSFAVLELNVHDLVGAGGTRLPLELLESLVLGVFVGIDFDSANDVEIKNPELQLALIAAVERTLNLQVPAGQFAR